MDTSPKELFLSKFTSKIKDKIIDNSNVVIYLLILIS